MNQYVKPLTWVLGVVLTILGIWGFFITTPLLIGLFEVDTTHNVVHLLSGVVALIAVASSMMYAQWYLKIFGIVYGLVTILGFATGNILGLFAVNPADNYLHLGIAAVCLIVGFGSGKMAMKSAGGGEMGM